MKRVPTPNAAQVTAAMRAYGLPEAPWGTWCKTTSTAGHIVWSRRREVAVATATVRERLFNLKINSDPRPTPNAGIAMKADRIDKVQWDFSSKALRRRVRHLVGSE